MRPFQHRHAPNLVLATDGYVRISRRNNAFSPSNAPEIIQLSAETIASLSSPREHRRLLPAGLSLRPVLHEGCNALDIFAFDF